MLWAWSLRRWHIDSGRETLNFEQRGDVILVIGNVGREHRYRFTYIIGLLYISLLPNS